MCDLETEGGICPGCPWRRKSAPGWLGDDMDAVDWLVTAHADDTVECHKRAGCHCIGLAIYRRNVCKVTRPPNPDGVVIDKVLVFSAPAEFHRHHTAGKELPADWVLRRFQKP